MPLTLSVIKLNLCITNHACLWKRPACDKWLPLRISYRRITITTRNNTQKQELPPRRSSRVWPCGVPKTSNQQQTAIKVLLLIAFLLFYFAFHFLQLFVSYSYNFAFRVRILEILQRGRVGYENPAFLLFQLLLKMFLERNKGFSAFLGVFCEVSSNSDQISMKWIIFKSNRSIRRIFVLSVYFRKATWIGLGLFLFLLLRLSMMSTLNFGVSTQCFRVQTKDFLLICLGETYRKEGLFRRTQKSIYCIGSSSSQSPL